MDLALSLLGEEIEGDLTSRNIILDLNTGHNTRVMFLPARSFIKILAKKNNSQYVGARISVSRGNALSWLPHLQGFPARVIPLCTSSALRNRGRVTQQMLMLTA